MQYYQQHSSQVLPKRRQQLFPLSLSDDCRLTGDAQDMSEHIYINKSGFSGFEYGCQAVSTIKKSSGQYVGKMNCSGASEDDLGIETISFQLQPNKKFKLTQNDGKKVYVNQYFKCSKWVIFCNPI